MFQFLEGEVLLVDKPINWTSFDVVNKLRYSIKKKLDIKKIKVGHAGTLDPLATGLLIICTGKKTKTIDQIQHSEKEYTGIITIGATTKSYDLECEIENILPTGHVTKKQILDTADSFVGKQEQRPPIFSAVKVNGKRAYKLARQGEIPEISTKSICINNFKVTKIENQNVHFEISCTKGTYIRSIARDFGEKLGVGAYLSELRRSKIGNYSISNALTIEKLLEQINQE